MKVIASLFLMFTLSAAVSALNPGDVSNPAECTAAGGTNVTSGGVWTGCWWPGNSGEARTGKLDIPKNCKYHDDKDGNPVEECDCPRCGHGDPPPAAKQEVPEDTRPQEVNGDPNRRTN